MSKSISTPLKYKLLWLSIGYLMVVFVIYSSLSTSEVVLEISLSDKLMHVLGYFGLMGWFMQIYRGRRAGLLLAVVFIAMGISLEFLQDLGGVRYFEVEDMLANTLGVLLAWGLSHTPVARILLWLERSLPGTHSNNAA
jgi:VanZ family protein